MLILTVGCAQTEYNTEEDRNVVIAKVNGQELYKAELNDRWSTVLPMMDATFAGLSDKEIKEKELEHKLKILDSMISEEINRQKASSNETNLSLSDEEIISLDIKFNEAIQSMEAYIMQNFNKAGISEIGEEQMTAELKAFFAGQGTTREDYYEDMKSIEIRRKLRTFVESEISSVSDDEIQLFYNKLLSEQQKLYTENTGRFEADMRDGDLVLNILYGYKIYKKIFIPYLAEDQEMIELMISSKLEIETLGAIEIAYTNLSEKIGEIYNQLDNNDKSFDDLMKEHNPTTADKIYYISEKTKTYTAATRDAALAIKSVGAYSKAVPQTNGVIIWMLAGEVENAGIIPLETVYDEIEMFALEEKRGIKWEQTQELWLSESKIKIFKNKLN
jgi:hypothetical protein